MPSIRASVSFPPELHTALKIACAHARKDLMWYVEDLLRRADKIPDKKILAALDSLNYDVSKAIKASIRLDKDLALRIKMRAEVLGLERNSQSKFIVAVVAHSMARQQDFE